MGICASCLGLRWHPSSEVDETDRLLDSSDHAQYGTSWADDGAQPDEEELRREREALEQITAEALDNMIDVSHPTSTDMSHHFAHTNHERHRDLHHATNGSVKGAREPEPEDDEEAAWLQSVQSAGLDTVTPIQALHSSNLVMDIKQLREEQQPSSAKKALRSAVR